MNAAQAHAEARRRWGTRSVVWQYNRGDVQMAARCCVGVTLPGNGRHLLGYGPTWVAAFAKADERKTDEDVAGHER